MLCEQCNCQTTNLVQIFKPGDDPVFLSRSEGAVDRSKHVPIALCGFCLVGEHVPVFRPSQQRWTIGEVLSSNEAGSKQDFLLSFGFVGNDREWARIEAKPFEAYLVEFRRQVKLRDTFEDVTNIENQLTEIQSATHQNLNIRSSANHDDHLDELSSLSYDETISPGLRDREEDNHVMEKDTGSVDASISVPRIGKTRSLEIPESKMDFENFSHEEIETATKYRRLWSEEEDAALLRVVALQGKRINWTDVSTMLVNRTSQQCRHRYIILIPSLKAKEWTPIEDAVLFHTYYCLSGCRWSIVSKKLKGRSENNVKNRFHHIRRRLEKFAAKLDSNGYSGDNELKSLLIEAATRFEVPWESITTVIDLLVHSLKEDKPLMTMHYDFVFDLVDSKTDGYFCSRCGLTVPSMQTGTQRCQNTGWCISCVETPAYLFGDMLRLHHHLRYSYRNSSK